MTNETFVTFGEHSIDVDGQTVHVNVWPRSITWQYVDRFGQPQSCDMLYDDRTTFEGIADMVREDLAC